LSNRVLKQLLANIDNMLHTFIFWLQTRRLINLVLIVGYFLFLLFMHDPLVLVSVWIEKQLGLQVYNMVVAAVFVLLVAILGSVLLRKLMAAKTNRALRLFYLLFTLLFLFTHSRFMFDSNIEIIHSLEFTGLAFLIFPLTRRFGATIFFTLPFMLFDEWYQYTVLYPLDYLDLNDIMTDTYGCALAMLTLMILGVKGSDNVKPFWQRIEFIALASGVVLVLVLVKLCIIAPYANQVCHNTLLLINHRLTEEPFWRPHPTHHIDFHVMKPLEALIAITTLHLFYFGLDSFRAVPKSPEMT
jgi:hypothetical protein